MREPFVFRLAETGAGIAATSGGITNSSDLSLRVVRLVIDGGAPVLPDVRETFGVVLRSEAACIWPESVESGKT